MNVFDMQRDMQAVGLYDGNIDGVWGPLSEAAWKAMVEWVGTRNTNVIPLHVPKQQDVAWSARVSPKFVARVVWMRGALNMPDPGADWLMACMAWETGETFSPSVRNGAGSGATGLIQFMPLTALAFWYTPAQIKAMSQSEKLAKGRACCELLANMTAEDQLDYVYRYFLPYKGRINALADLYMAILWPAGIGKPAAHVLWEQGTAPKTYLQNKGLDVDGDKRITKAEAASKVQVKLEKGRLAANRRTE